MTLPAGKRLLAGVLAACPEKRGAREGTGRPKAAG